MGTMVKTKTFKQQLRAMKQANYSKLRNAVITDLLSYSKDNDDLLSHTKDIVNYGLSSGVVASLIYYTDTCKFFKRHKSDIMTMVKNSMKDFGYKSLEQMFGDKWDEEDMLIEEISNQNLLAWYAYEETVLNVLNELDIEY